MPALWIVSNHDNSTGDRQGRTCVVGSPQEVCPLRKPDTVSRETLSHQNYSQNKSLWKTPSMLLPPEVETSLRTASLHSRQASKKFVCNICGNEWDQFIEKWASICYWFVGEAFAGFHTEPLPEILPLTDPLHSSGANASFDIVSGQIRLSPSIVEHKPGITLEKLTHEMTHGALAGFPEGDPFYEEGFTDYSVWIMAHAPVWNPWGKDMIEAAAFNIKCRRDRAMKSQSDYDRKRWAGGLFASTALGPWIITHLKMKKLEGNLTW